MGNMMHQRHRSSSPVSLGILLFGACVTFMITEVDSLRYTVISRGVSYHKTPKHMDLYHVGGLAELKKGTTICATPVNKDWVKVTGKGYLPIRVPMWSNSFWAFGAVKILKEFGGLTVAGAGLKSADEPSLCPDGCYVKREADHYPQPKPYKKCSRASEWNRAHHGQWYERHDGAFIYFGWHTNDWRWCIFSKNGVCQYFSDPANYEDGPPADGWTLTHRGHRCQGCRGNRLRQPFCLECHATGSVEYAAPTVRVS